MDKTLHPVTLDRDLCTGCTTCVKRCPTEAIRVRNKHAIILHDRCIVCSECIRLCPAHAKKAQVDKLADALAAHPYTVALVPPVLYAQFSGLRDRNIALTALLQLGFVPQPRGPAEFGGYLRSEVDRWAKIIRDANIQIA